MAVNMLDRAREDALPTEPDDVEVTDAPQVDEPRRSAAEAQAQRESYLRKGEELIHSLL